MNLRATSPDFFNLKRLSIGVYANIETRRHVLRCCIVFIVEEYMLTSMVDSLQCRPGPHKTKFTHGNMS